MWFLLSWQGLPPQNSAQNIWDHVGFYTMHMFLALQLRAISNDLNLYTKLIIFNQVSHLIVLSILCIGSTTLLFKTPPKSNAHNTLNSKPCFRWAVRFSRSQKNFRTRPSNWLYVRNRQIGVKNQDFCSLHIFKCNHASYLVPESSSKIILQETHAGYDTLAARQNDYSPQEPQRFEGFIMQEREAE